jgi:hypothetical protein
LIVVRVRGETTFWATTGAPPAGMGGHEVVTITRRRAEP